MSRTSEEPGAVRNRAEVLRVLQEARQARQVLRIKLLEDQSQIIFKIVKTNISRYKSMDTLFC